MTCTPGLLKETAAQEIDGLVAIHQNPTILESISEN